MDFEELASAYMDYFNMVEEHSAEPMDGFYDVKCMGYAFLCNDEIALRELVENPIDMKMEKILNKHRQEAFGTTLYDPWEWVSIDE